MSTFLKSVHNINARREALLEDQRLTDEARFTGQLPNPTHGVVQNPMQDEELQFAPYQGIWEGSESALIAPSKAKARLNDIENASQTLARPFNFENAENLVTPSSGILERTGDILKELQDEAKLNQVREYFSGGLVGFFGESRAKEFVDYIKSYRELSKEDFYAATPDVQLTLLKDWAQQQQGFDSQSAKSENKRSRDGALQFNEVAVQSDKLLNDMAAARAGTDPSLGDFKVERTKLRTANAALKNVLKDIQDSKDRSTYNSIDTSITPKALETILTESITEYEAAALASRADSGYAQKLFSGTPGFKGNGALSDTEFNRLQRIVRAKIVQAALDYDKQLASALSDSVAGQQAGSDLEGVLDTIAQLKSNL